MNTFHRPATKTLQRQKIQQRDVWNEHPGRALLPQVNICAVSACRQQKTPEGSIFAAEEKRAQKRN